MGEGVGVAGEAGVGAGVSVGNGVGVGVGAGVSVGNGVGVGVGARVAVGMASIVDFTLAETVASMSGGTDVWVGAVVGVGIAVGVGVVVGVGGKDIGVGVVDPTQAVKTINTVE